MALYEVTRMPLYLFECPNGHKHELFYRMADKPDSFQCHCGQFATQVPAIGGIHGESATWINSDLREVLQDSDRVRKGIEKPIESRSEVRAAEKRLGVECRGGRMV
jgi:predicted nucleic acid-binding Zn ribbon protein